MHDGTIHKTYRKKIYDIIEKETGKEISKEAHERVKDIMKEYVEEGIKLYLEHNRNLLKALKLKNEYIKHYMEQRMPKSTPAIKKYLEKVKKIDDKVKEIVASKEYL